MVGKESTFSNVQGDLVEGRSLLSVPIESIIPDPERPNIRGKVVDTTDIQPSIREHGILQPLLVRPVPDQPGMFYRIAGERRQVAARAVGLKEVPVIVGEDLEERDIRRIMFASDLHKREPHIVLGPDGQVIAGKAKAVHEELSDEETNITRQDLAGDLGVSSDIIGAYFVLYSDIPEIQAKVANGQMGITVYSLVKHHGPELKRYLAKKKGKVSANYVRTSLKEWDERIQPKLDKEAAAEEAPVLAEAGEGKEFEVLESKDSKSGTVSIKVTQRVTVTQLLSGAFDNLNKIVVNKQQLSGTDWSILDEILRVAGMIENGQKDAEEYEDANKE